MAQAERAPVSRRSSTSPRCRRAAQTAWVDVERTLRAALGCRSHLGRRPAEAPGLTGRAAALRRASSQEAGARGEAEPDPEAKASVLTELCEPSEWAGDLAGAEKVMVEARRRPRTRAGSLASRRFRGSSGGRGARAERRRAARKGARFDRTRYRRCLGRIEVDAWSAGPRALVTCARGEPRAEVHERARRSRAGLGTCVPGARRSAC